MVLFVKPLGNGTGFKDKRKNQIFQFIGQTSENLIAKLKSRQTSARDWWKSASQLVGRNSREVSVHLELHVAEEQYDPDISVAVYRQLVLIC
jgi:L-rhamnose mutarotase